MLPLSSAFYLCYGKHRSCLFGKFFLKIPYVRMSHIEKTLVSEVAGTGAKGSITGKRLKSMGVWHGARRMNAYPGNSATTNHAGP